MSNRCGTTEVHILWDYTHSTHVLTYVNTQVSNFVGLQKYIVWWTTSPYFVGLHDVQTCGTRHVQPLWDYRSPYFVGLHNVQTGGTRHVQLLWDYRSLYFVGLHRSIFCGTTQCPHLWESSHYISPYFVRLRKSLFMGHKS